MKKGYDFLILTVTHADCTPSWDSSTYVISHTLLNLPRLYPGRPSLDEIEADWKFLSFATEEWKEIMRLFRLCFPLILTPTGRTLPPDDYLRLLHGSTIHANFNLIIYLIGPERKFTGTIEQIVIMELCGGNTTALIDFFPSTMTNNE